MTPTQFIARLPALYYAALEEGGPSYYLEGDPGCAKTSAYRTFPKTMKRVDPSMNYGFALINGANFTLMTAMGFMVPKEVTRGGLLRTVSVFSDPYWMYTAEGKHLSEYDGGILLVDEYDKLGLDEKKIVGETALSKVLGTHRLPPGWVVMFAGNYLHNRSGGTRDLDHMIMRRISLQMTQDAEGWAEWAKGAGLLPVTILFAEENPQLLYEKQDPKEQRPRCSPRTLHQIDIHLRSLMMSFDTDVIPTDPLTIEEIKGGIGLPAQTQYVKTIRLDQEVPSYDEVIANPLRVTLPTRLDCMRLLCYKMASRVKAKDAEKVITFMSRMPQEHMAIFVQMAIQREYELALEPHFLAWCGKHSALTAILQRYKVTDK